MLSREDNERLTRTGAGTPMGEYVRRFWIPVALASELAAPDGDPLRLRLLGEDLVLFRDTKGRVGLLDEHCPHRLASLYFGRNEDCGIRCIYHGWKFDVTGACLDMPNEPPSSNFKDKVTAKAYPTRERGGLIWAYLGPAATLPTLPGFEWLDLPSSHRYASRWQTDCNFVQAMEGEMDTSHVGFLHSRIDALAQDKMALTGAFFHEDRAPKFHIERTPYGMVAAGRRDVDGDKAFWRMNQFLLPFYSMIPPVPGNALMTRAWIPRDDVTSWVVCVTFRPDRPLGNDEIARWQAGVNTHRDLIPGTTQPRAHRDNNYLQDRRQQRTASFSGIEGVRNQDACVTESQGPIVDRTREHLGVADTAVIQMRKALLDGARALAQGREPAPAQDGALYRIRAGHAVIARGVAYDQSAEIRASMQVPEAERSA
jgi:phthalate 4,5-dioxygenase oxygenase subunit